MQKKMWCGFKNWNVFNQNKKIYRKLEVWSEFKTKAKNWNSKRVKWLFKSKNFTTKFYFTCTVYITNAMQEKWNCRQKTNFIDHLNIF